MAGANEFLAFRVGDEEYGVNILDVQEIRQYEAPTRIANAPAHTVGVVNLRGIIVPITDLGHTENRDTASARVVLRWALGLSGQELAATGINPPRETPSFAAA